MCWRCLPRAPAQPCRGALGVALSCAGVSHQQRSGSATSLRVLLARAVQRVRCAGLVPAWLIYVGRAGPAVTGCGLAAEPRCQARLYLFVRLRRQLLRAARIRPDSRSPGWAGLAAWGAVRRLRASKRGAWAAPSGVAAHCGARRRRCSARPWMLLIVGLPAESAGAAQARTALAVALHQTSWAVALPPTSRS